MLWLFCRLFRVIAHWFTIAFFQKKRELKKLKEIERGIVQRYSRGDWRLTLGMYLTEEDIDVMRGRVLRYRF